MDAVPEYSHRVQVCFQQVLMRDNVTPNETARRVVATLHDLTRISRTSNRSRRPVHPYTPDDRTFVGGIMATVGNRSTRSGSE